MVELTEIKQKLQEFQQAHLLDFWDELDSTRREALLEQLGGVNFEQLKQQFEHFASDQPHPLDADEIAPPEVLPHRPADDQQAQLYRNATQRGLQLLSEGKVAACVVAGGQGTRLGFDGPKGCFQATPVAKKSLFQVFAEQIQAASVRAGKAIPWYIMTSLANHTQTQAFLRRNNYFGLQADNVKCFVQGAMPAIGLDGKLLLQSRGTLAVSPDGHGGILPALRLNGCLDDMAQRGVTLISYFQVDNPMVRCIDPLFIGLHDLNQSEMSAKALPKRDPMEKLGNFCVIDGKTTVIEYSDMPDELAMRTDDRGFLKFSAGSIAIHVLSRSFVGHVGRTMLPAVPPGQESRPVHRRKRKTDHPERTQRDQAGDVHFRRAVAGEQDHDPRNTA